MNWSRIERAGAAIHVAGIDDAHFFRVDNIEKAAADIPVDDFSILLSHTPEIYRQAAHAGFDAILSGHTHGGQICLPGSIPITLDATLPRAFGSGAWKYNEMSGYTSCGAGSSVLPVRLNCPPEITLHTLAARLKVQYGRSRILRLNSARDRMSSPIQNSAVAITTSAERQAKRRHAEDQRQQAFGGLVDARRHAVRRQLHAALDEARQQIAGHRAAAAASAPTRQSRPSKGAAIEAATKLATNAANCLRFAKQRFAVAPERAEIDRRRAPSAENPRRQKRRAIRHENEDQPLKDGDEMHGRRLPLRPPGYWLPGSRHLRSLPKQNAWNRRRVSSD